MEGRIPPSAPEIEQSILGTCLTDAFAFREIRELIDPEVFYINNNRIVFESCLSSEEPDILIVEGHLKDCGKLDQIGGISYLADLTSRSTPRHEQYCQILIEKKIIRDAIQSAQTILKKAYDNTDAYALTDEFARLGQNLGQRSAIKHSFTPSEIKERDKNKPKAEKLFTGYSNLDFGIFGDSMKRGQTILTIADSGHGKTQCGLFLSECLLRKGHKIAWFQLEGYDSETAARFDVDNIFICDSLYDIEDIKREARRLNREYNIDFIVFDYVQNIECNQKISKTEKVEYISKEIQKLAKELNCVSNPLSQVTIEESRHGWQQEPRYNDVRWSKQLKQDADLIISMFRPSRIDSLVVSEEKTKDWNDNLVPYNSVFLKQAKVRHGKQEWKRFQMIHTDKGLQPYTNEEAPF